MNVKSVNFEGIFNFTFGIGKGENLIVNLTQFIDSKMYAGGDNSGDSDGRSGDGDDLNVRPEPSAQLDPETTQATSTRVHNSCPYGGWLSFRCPG